MSKQIRVLAAFVIPHVCVLFFCLIMILSNLAIPFINGFAVDSTGRVYVGEMNSIRVMHDRKTLDSIWMGSSTYTFTIDSNDHILAAYPTCYDLMDREGNILKTIEDPHATMYSQLQRNDHRFLTENGDRYKKTEILGWIRIVKNDSEVVYSISLFSYIVKFLMYLCGLSMFINGVWVIYHLRRINTRRI